MVAYTKRQCAASRTWQNALQDAVTLFWSPQSQECSCAAGGRLLCLSQYTSCLQPSKLRTMPAGCAGTAAILAVGGSKPTVTADANGRIGVEKQMQVNLTCDHRIVYGAQAAEFLVALKAVIENPEQLTL